MPKTVKVDPLICALMQRESLLDQARAKGVSLLEIELPELGGKKMGDCCPEELQALANFHKAVGELLRIRLKYP